MTQTKQQCSTPDQLLTFLRGQLSFREEAELQQHLDACVACRERLESTAADASVWNEAKEFFGNRALHAATRGTGEDHDDSNHGQYRIRQVLDSIGPTDDPESLGRIGGYEVTGVVGAGGMGVVLKAQDRSLDRIVAIKVMAPHLASSGSARKRFAREAKAAAAVLHPNVIAIHSVASEDANPYLVMPFVRGASLQKRIDSQGPLPLKDTLRIGAQIAAGLAAAHEQGLVHRDIKPANILLEEGVERVTITDFGLARAVDDASMTCSGVIAGTPQYMSPEQARGEPIDARSDLFSLGGVLYAMCTGRSPFRAETTYGVLHRIANDKPTAVCEVNTDVPVWLGHVIDRLIAKRPEDRFESAAQVAELIEGCLAHVQQPAAIPLPVGVQALAAQTQQRSSEIPKPNRLKAGHQRIPPIGKLIAAAAFAFALFFAGVFIVLELNKGTLTIQSDVDDLRIRITSSEQEVNELQVTKAGKSIRVAAGQYTVEVVGETDDLTIENGHVTLHRADTEVVRILHNTGTLNKNEVGKKQSSNQWLNQLQGSWHVEQVVPGSRDSLAISINQFNSLQAQDPQNDQPVLTKDELVACASWNIERNHELTQTLYAALGKIAKQHQWPEGWRIDGSYLDLPPEATPVRAYRISLVHATTGEEFTVRERFIEPSSAYASPLLNASLDDGTQLRAAIKRFNARFNQANGVKQPPLTENEVVAAIVHHQTKRDEADVSDSLFEKFQQIAKTRYLPEGVSLEVIPTFGVEGGSTYTIWSVRIKMFQDEPGKEGWTYAFEIREQFVSVKYGDAGKIHWGLPAENGLQAGVRLSPPRLSYQLGQKIDVQVLYRNILTKPISTTVPNFCGYEVAVHDISGAKMEVFDLQEPIIVGGARSAGVGDEPVSSIGRSFAFAPSSLEKDKRQEYRSRTGASLLILVEPGKSYRLQFTVGNVVNDAEGTINSGEIEVAVEPEVNFLKSSMNPALNKSSNYFLTLKLYEMCEDSVKQLANPTIAVVEDKPFTCVAGGIVNGSFSGYKVTGNVSALDDNAVQTSLKIVVGSAESRVNSKLPISETRTVQLDEVTWLDLHIEPQRTDNVLKLSANEIEVVSKLVPTQVRGTGSVTLTLPAEASKISSDAITEERQIDLSTPQATLETIDLCNLNDPAHVPVDCYTEDALLEMSGVMLQQLGYMSVISQLYSPLDAQIRIQTGGEIDAKDSGPIIPGALPSFRLQVDALLKEHSLAMPPEPCKKAFELLLKSTVASLEENETRVIPDRQLYRLAAGVLKSTKEFLPKASELSQQFHDSSSQADAHSSKVITATQYDIVIEGDEAVATTIVDKNSSAIPMRFKLLRVNERWLVSEAFSDEILAQINLSMPQIAGDMPATKTESAMHSPKVSPFGAELAKQADAVDSPISADHSKVLSELPENWTDFQALLNEKGTALVMLSDQPEIREQMSPIARKVARGTAIHFIEIQQTVPRSDNPPANHFPSTHYLLMKDRQVVDTRYGVLTEEKLQEFVVQATDWLTPRSTGVEENSLVRIDCYIFPDAANTGQQSGDAYPITAAVVAVHEDQTLLLGPDDVAKYIEKGYACVAVVRDADDKEKQFPLEVLFNEPVKLLGLHGEPHRLQASVRVTHSDGTASELPISSVLSNDELTPEPLDKYDVASAIYSINGVQGLKPVKLNGLGEAISVGERVLSGSFSQKPIVPVVLGFSPPIQWQSQTVVGVDGVTGGNMHGPETFRVLCPSLPVPSGYTFDERGRLIGKRLGGDPTYEDMRHDVYKSHATHSILRAVLDKIEDAGLKAALMRTLEQSSSIPQETSVAPSNNNSKPKS